MRKFLLFMVLLTLSCSSYSYGQSLNYFEEKFRLGSVTNFQEKLYIQTDRDSYTAGETIWFRVHRADATYHNPQIYSGLVYVNIYDFKDKLVKQMMIMPTDSVFSGSYKTRQSTVQGFYYMVAYTNWMQNFDTDMFYRRKIFVNNTRQHKNSVTSEFHLDTRNRLRVDFNLISTDKHQWLDESYLLDVEMFSSSNKLSPKRTVTRKITNEGKSDAYIPLDDSIELIRVGFNDEGQYDIEYDDLYQVISVPYVVDEIDLQFMPEGGHLIADIYQRVAFKALSIDGLGASVTGTIFDSSGAMVSLFSSSYLGMGNVMFKPKFGESYYAEITMKDGSSRRYDLPEVQESGIALSCTVNAKIIRVMAKASKDISWSGKHFVLHCRGKLLHGSPMKSGAIFDFPTQMLPNGILQCSIVDTLGNIYSQRLLFVNKDDEPQVVAEGIKNNYIKRNLVNIDLTINDAKGEPISGFFTASVVDDSRAVVDTMGSDIRSYMLLTSDLTGNIERPNYYFDTTIDASERARDADLLMMTQGWRRFDLTDIILGTMREYPYSLELGQSIQGRLKKVWKDQGSQGNFIAIAPTENIVRLVSTDEEGYFEVKNIKFPYGTRFIIQGLNEKNKKQVEVQMYEEEFEKISNPPIDSRYLLREDIKEYNQETELDRFNKFYKDKNSGYYYDNGELVFLMSEISVVAEEEKPEDRLDRMYEKMSDYRITGEELVEQGYATIWDWLSDIPGVMVDEINQSVRARGNKSVTLVINEDKLQFEYLNYVNVEDVVSVGYSMEFTALGQYANGNGGAVILILLKEGVTVTGSRRKDLISFYSITPMGYHVADTFYVPLYDTRPLLNSTNLDSRVTIHWEPSLRIDESGKTSFEFYTADFQANYLVRIEGITTAGDPVSFMTRIKNDW